MKEFLAFACLVSTVLCADQLSSHRIYKLIRLRPADDGELNFLINLTKDASKYELDVWKEPSTVGRTVDVMIPGSSFDSFRRILQKRGLTYNVTIDDVQTFIQKQQDTKNDLLKNRRLKDDSSSSNLINVAQYNSYSDIEKYMDDLQRTYPQLVQIFNIGTTHERRNLKVIKIGTTSSSSKKSIWIDAGIHAREWIAPSTAVWFINQLVTKYNEDPQIRKYVDELDWFIMPVLNPDGYEFSRSSVDPKMRLWRKNKSPAICRKNSWGNQECCQGVDLNRNFDFHWGELGTSKNPCDEMYSGTFAFSEPETKAIQDFLLQRNSVFQSFITLHSYSQIWMYPYGHEKRSYPADVSDLHTLALQAKKAIQNMYGTKYIVGTGADTLYPASGGSDDWAKQSLNIKYSYLIELRPQENVFGGFLLDESQIVPTARETFEGIKVIADTLITGALPKTPAPDDNECKNTESQCGWWASLGACKTWPNMDKRCPLSCRLCDQKK